MKKKNSPKTSPTKKKQSPPTTPIKPKTLAAKVPRFAFQPPAAKSPTPPAPAKSTKHPAKSTISAATSTKPPSTTRTETNLCTLDHMLSLNHSSNSTKSYFEPAYYRKYPKCTQICARCQGKFGTEKKITTKTSAMCCINQFHKSIKCSHAFCTPCYAIKMGYCIDPLDDEDKENAGEEAANNEEATNNDSFIGL